MSAEESHRLKNLAPSSKRAEASGNLSSSKPGPVEEVDSNNKRRRTLVNAACASCRRRKRQCSGERPQCSYCRSHKIECQYNVPEGIPRSTYYVQRTKELESRVGDLESLLETLRSGTDQEASGLLARLRIGEESEDIIRELQSGTGTPLEVDSRPRSSPSEHSNAGSVSGQPREHHLVNPHLQPLIDRNGWIELKHNLIQGPQTTHDGNTFERGAANSYNSHNGDQRVTQESRPDHSSLLVRRMARNQNSSPTRMSFFMQQNTRPSSREDGSEGLAPQNEFVMVTPNLANQFGNLNFSAAIRSNNYPDNVQSQQLSNLYVARWAMFTPTQQYHGAPNAVPNAWDTIYKEAQDAFNSGTSLNEFCGVHPYVAALSDPDVFARAPRLSQWAAQSVYSIRLTNPGIVEFVSMGIFWSLMRWMIQPSPETYEDVPEWLRPTPTQLFVPHALVWDFLIWPSLRSLISERTDLGFTSLSWALELALGVQFHWSKTLEDALQHNSVTGELDLSAEAKAAFKDIHSWSCRPAFRQHLPNADAYVRIQYQDG